MAPVQNRIMGEAPYDVYTIFFNVIHESIDFGGGLEHSYSQFDIMPAPAFADPVSGNSVTSSTRCCRTNSFISGT